MRRLASIFALTGVGLMLCAPALADPSYGPGPIVPRTITVGSTAIANGATVTTIAGLTLSSPTLTGTTTSAAINASNIVAITRAANGMFTLTNSTSADTATFGVATTNGGGVVGTLAGDFYLYNTTAGTGRAIHLSTTGSDDFNMLAGVVTVSAGLVTPAITFTGTAPIPTGTGTPTIVAGSTDSAGEVASGASATSVVITFATSKTNAPFCTVTPQTQLIAFAYTISTTAITITQTATTGEKIDYVCIQH